jgi:hypothetical protein
LVHSYNGSQRNCRRRKFWADQLHRPDRRLYWALRGRLSRGRADRLESIYEIGSRLEKCPCGHALR